MPYEATQMRAYLKDYAKRIKDLLTTEEDIRRYEEFNRTLGVLSTLTDLHYRERIPFTQEHRIAIRRSYEDSLRAAAAVLHENADGPVSLQMKTVVREMTPLMMMDLHAIELVEGAPDLASHTLPELIGRVRTQAAELGEQAGPVGDGPMPLRLEDGNGTQTGVFRPAVHGAPDGQATAYSRLAGLLGQSELVTKSRSMLLNHAGGSTVGTFSSRADGVDPADVKPGDPLLSFNAVNLDTPAAVSGLAAMQAMDYLFGAEGRGPENCCMRFNPPYSGAARLVGLSVKSDGVAIGDGAGDEARLAGLGAIPESLYLQIADADFPNRLRQSLRDCELPEGAVERMLARRDALLEKVQRDFAFFDDKEVGFLEQNRVRLVPDNEWPAYRAENLAAVNGEGYFAKLLTLPNAVKERVGQQAGQNEPMQALPIAKVVGNGLRQAPDPLNAARPENIRLHIPSLDQDSAMKGNQNSRYPIQWVENGQLRQGLFTLPNVFDNRPMVRNILAPYLEKPANKNYRDLLLAVQDYYAVENSGAELPDMPSKVSELPWREMGLSEERYQTLLRDRTADSLLHDIQIDYLQRFPIQADEFNLGASYGQRLELRNVAMSEIADELGVPDLLARSTTAQVELDGKVVDGIFMNAAEGVDFSKVEKGSALASITAEQAKTVYNTEGLKDLADIQILDYICMNTDRHAANMFYRFEGLETGNPKFLGVQGIDNDLAFGTKIPDENKVDGWLPALKDIRVISSSMAQALNRPELMDGIAAKMRKNGLKEPEIDAARKRVEKLRKKVRNGSIRTVQNGQWGKGENTVERLDGGQRDSSIFHHFKQKLIDPMAEYAAESGRMPGNYVPMAKPKFQTVQKVDQFGGTALAATEREKLEKRASERFLRQLEQNTESKVRVDNPEHQAVFALRGKLDTLMTMLDQGDLPWPWGSSEYRDMHKACKRLQKYTESLSKKLEADPEREITKEESDALKQHLNTLADRSSAYSAYKQDDLQRRDPGYYTPLRQNAANSCASLASGAVNVLAKARTMREKPMYLVHDALRQAQADLSGKTGQALREQTARVLCLNGMTRIGLSKKTGMGIRKALHEDTMQRQMARIQREPGFKNLAALPDDELRALAAGEGGRALADSFIREIAREGQIAASAQPQQQPARRQPAQPNAEAAAEPVLQ